MSLLEDVFLQDEASEAQELERVIEGDEYDEIPRALSPNSDDNSERDDEAEEDKRRVDPAQGKTKRVVKNPRFILNPARLTGPRGIQVIPEHFKDFKFKGKGHEKDDLDMVLKKLEHWAYRLYPKFKFEDCLKKIETLGKKRPVMVHLHKIRTDQFISEETVVQKDSSDDEDTLMPQQEDDEFDKLLQQQIDLARATPAPGSVKKPGFSTPKFDKSPLTMPKATSSPSISDEQRNRMLKNRKLAEERRLATLNQNSSMSNIIDEIPTIDLGIEHSEKFEGVNVRKHNRSNIIDSSDDESDLTSVNQSVVVDIHNTANKNSNQDIENDCLIDDPITECGHNELLTEIFDDNLNDKQKYCNQKTVEDSNFNKDIDSFTNIRMNINIPLQENDDTNCDEFDGENTEIIMDSIKKSVVDKRANLKVIHNDTEEITCIDKDVKHSIMCSNEQNVSNIVENSVLIEETPNQIFSEEIATAIPQVENNLRGDETNDQKNLISEDCADVIDMDINFSDDF